MVSSLGSSGYGGGSSEARDGLADFFLLLLGFGLVGRKTGSELSCIEPSVSLRLRPRRTVIRSTLLSLEVALDLGLRLGLDPEFLVGEGRGPFGVGERGLEGEEGGSNSLRTFLERLARERTLLGDVVEDALHQEHVVRHVGPERESRLSEPAGLGQAEENPARD